MEVEQSELCDGEISSMRRRGALLGSCRQQLWRFRKSWQTLNMTEHILVSAAVFIILRHNLLPFLQLHGGRNNYAKIIKRTLKYFHCPEK